MTVSSTPYHHPTPWDTQFKPQALPDMLAQTAARNPQAPFLHFMGRTFSYDRIAKEADYFACRLKYLGIEKGDRVGLFLPNVPLYAIAYYGAMLAGAVVVNFSPLYTVEELAWQVEDSGTKVLVTLDVPELYQTASNVLESSGLERLIVGSLADQLPGMKSFALRTLGRGKIAKVAWSDCILKLSEISFDPTLDLDEVGSQDLALLQYTGGTTGRPKGAMLGHDQLSMNAQQVAAINPFGVPDREVFLGALPFFHVFANTSLLNHAMVTGAAIVMLPRFDAGQVLKAIAKYKATGFPGVPTMFQALLDHPDIAKTDLSSLKVCISGGAPMPAPVHEKFESVTGVRVVEGYGLTESSGVVSANPYAGMRKKGTIGQPVAGTAIVFLDKEDPSKLAADGEPGELAVHGPQIMRGYWNKPDAFDDTFVMLGNKAYLRTGDVAVMDEEGFLQIVDRIKDMIAVGGFKVFPSQVEDVLLENDAVKEALVIGVPHDYLGEMPRAYITLQSGNDLTGGALADWLNTRVGKHERVESVVIRDELPKTLIGKLDRKALRAEVFGES